MSRIAQPMGYAPAVAAESPVEARARFIVRTYNTLFLAILAFTAIEIALFWTGLAEPIAATLASTNWLLILAAFMGVSWIASHVAHSAQSKLVQYAALSAFVGVWAVLFVPMLVIADDVAPGAIQSAGLVTMLGFAGLTAIAFVTRKDFSFLRGFLMWGMLAAVLLIVAAVIFGFELGILFSVAMVGFAGAAILYDTSNVLHHFPTDRHVGAALQLFSSVALLLWYVLRIFIAARD